MITTSVVVLSLLALGHGVREYFHQRKLRKAYNRWQTRHPRRS